MPVTHNCCRASRPVRRTGFPVAVCSTRNDFKELGTADAATIDAAKPTELPSTAHQRAIATTSSVRGKRIMRCLLFLAGDEAGGGPWGESTSRPFQTTKSLVPANRWRTNAVTHWQVKAGWIAALLQLELRRNNHIRISISAIDDPCNEPPSLSRRIGPDENKRGDAVASPLEAAKIVSSELFLLGLCLVRSRIFRLGLGHFLHTFLGSWIGFCLLGFFLTGFFLRRGFLEQLLLGGVIVCA